MGHLLHSTCELLLLTSYWFKIWDHLLFCTIYTSLPDAILLC